MFPMQKFPSQFNPGDIVAIGGRNYTIKSVKPWEGCTEVRFKENGDVHYLMDDRKYQYQIPGLLS